MKLLLFYFFWSVPPAIITHYRMKRDKIDLGHNLPVLACFIWGWIVALDYSEMKRRMEWGKNPTEPPKEA